MKNYFLPFILVLWLTAILTLFFVFQKPDFLSIMVGIENLFLIIFIPFLMTILAACMGAHLLPEGDPIERLIFGVAIGMAIFGLAGFGLAITGWARPIVLSLIILSLTAYYILTGKLVEVWKDTKYLTKEIYASAKNIAPWIPINTGIGLALTFILGLTPPVEDFDAMLYHLAVPQWWLRDGGLILSKSVGYWVPHIVEGSFIVPMVFGVDTATHLIHLLWLILTMLILWHWTRQLWDDSIAWWAIAILLTMPSLLLLASWAYTDYALTFAGIATIYSIWKSRDKKTKSWIITGGIMAGIAMGTKYQSFFIPFVAVLLIAIWQQENLERIKKIASFSLTAILVASPWYVRNWILMGNPLYPFVFGGRYWDSFLANIQPGAPGSGIGFDFRALLLLPLTATLGAQDKNFFDGRIGPFFLILLPLGLWALWQSYKKGGEQYKVLLSIYLLGATGITAWVAGVINIDRLFQSRYLFPSIIPLTIPLSLGLNMLYQLDAPRLRVSFVFKVMLAIVVFINLFNVSLFTIIRNPIAVAIGMVSRQQYMENQQPEYTRILELVNKLPSNARVYFLFEPRSYGANVYVEPDGINSHFAHDILLYKSPQKIISAWKQQGYTYVLLSTIGADFVFHNEGLSSPNEEALLKQVEALLISIDKSQNGKSVLYKIP